MMQLQVKVYKNIPDSECVIYVCLRKHKKKKKISVGFADLGNFLQESLISIHNQYEDSTYKIVQDYVIAS